MTEQYYSKLFKFPILKRELIDMDMIDRYHSDENFTFAKCNSSIKEALN